MGDRAPGAVAVGVEEGARTEVWSRGPTPAAGSPGELEYMSLVSLRDEACPRGFL